MQMSEVVEEHPSLIPVINRFGIRLGVGDKTVRELCDAYMLDTDFMLTVINTFLNEEYFPEKKLQSFHISQIVDYLTKTNHYYRRYQLPNIERHLGRFVSMNTTDNQSLAAIGNFFAAFKKEFEARIETDEKEWFPYCLTLKGKYKPHEDTIEALLADLKRIMIRHLTGDYDENLCYAVIVALSNLEKELKQQNRIRYRILEPMVNALEKNL